MSSYWRVLLGGGLFLAGMLLVTSAAASELYTTTRIPVPVTETMRVDMDVLVDGRPVPLIGYNGRLFLPVPRMGAEYEIRVSNQGSRRIVAIVSVDGLSVINGRPAAENGTGYIVGPHRSIVIPGWRKDRSSVAAFTFSPREDSYAARRGYPDNVGVIGLVAFEERAPIIRPMPVPLEKDAAWPRRALSELGGTGTGYGRDIDAPVIEVPFERSGNRRSLAIYYDTPEALRRIGVPIDPPRPRPFPGDGDWCPPPR